MNLALTDNKPISLDRAGQALESSLQRLAEQYGAELQLETLGKVKSVADATSRFLIQSVRGKPLAVVLCSRPIAPGLVARGVETAEEIRNVIGAELGAAIIKPLEQGQIDGCSYVILPYCFEFSSWKICRVLQRHRIRRPVFDWLLSANAQARSFHQENSSSAAPSFQSALAHLLQQKLFGAGRAGGEINKDIQIALDRIQAGKWIPAYTFDHNDLYLLNIMLPGRQPAFDDVAAGRLPFVIIDWVGANPRGFGVYDLVRLSRAFKLSDQQLREQLQAHSTALGCELVDTTGHLLAALGRLHQHLEHFPEHRYIETAVACWTSLKRALTG